PATVQEGWVVSSTFFGIRESDGRIVGMIDIRHTLNDFLRNNGGHIGYGVRPSERFKGYATRMLELALEKCRQLGLERVMLACEKENTASRKTIMKCGGGLEREFEHSDGKTVQVFWITI
ncbi:MAG: GNAT family N-acetyltransferase, partial [Leptolinea sp.]|nr:GNAT family N-acetyltransferase [Leptolinea sp.]